MTDGYVFNINIRLIKKVYCNSNTRHLFDVSLIMKIALSDFNCENTWPYHCDKKNSSTSNKNTL